MKSAPRKRVKSKNKVKSLKALKNEAWAKISVYVRSLGADWQGYTYCYTCLKRFHWKDLDCGHFFHNRLDYDLRNLRKQCTACNRFKHGNLGIYAIKLTQELGLKGIKQLEKDSIKKGNNYSRQELFDIINKFSDKGMRS